MNRSRPKRGGGGHGPKRGESHGRGKPRPHRQGPAQNEPHPLRDGARWVVGIHSCEEVLKVRPKAIRELWLKEDFEHSQALRELAEKAERARVRLATKPQKQLDQIGSGHQGVALAVTEDPELDWADFAEGKHIVLALDGLEDPHNLGSILRTAWLCGVSAILIPEDRAVGLTPAVCKIASGGAEHVPVEAHTNLASAIEKLKEVGFWVYGLSEKGSRKPWEFQLPDKVIWVVGHEGTGMRITTERVCDELVRIPQVESGSSFNASIAVAMALSETCRQFGTPE